MKRATIYSGVATLLLFMLGCAGLTEAVKDVEEFAAGVDPEAIEQGAKTTGTVVSYFFPAVGGAITTAGTAIGWLFERGKKKKYFTAAEGYAKALEEVKKDLKDGGQFTSWQELREILESSQAAGPEGKRVYRELKERWAKLEQQI